MPVVSAQQAVTGIRAEAPAKDCPDCAVVVIVAARPNVAADACDAAWVRRTTSVTLAAPLGLRTVLEITQGRPVPVRVTP